MGEVLNSNTPSEKIDNIERGEGREQKTTLKIKSFAWDWDGVLERLFNKLFKRKDLK